MKMPLCPECNNKMVPVGKCINGKIIWACVDTVSCKYTEIDELEKIIDGYMDRSGKNKQKKKVQKGDILPILRKTDVSEKDVARLLKLPVCVVKRISEKIRETNSL